MQYFVCIGDHHNAESSINDNIQKRASVPQQQTFSVQLHLAGSVAAANTGSGMAALVYALDDGWAWLRASPPLLGCAMRVLFRKKMLIGG